MVGFAISFLLKAENFLDLTPGLADAGGNVAEFLRLRTELLRDYYRFY